MNVEWITLPGLAPYPETVAAMEEKAADIKDNGAADAVWLLEHPPLYTGGTSADAADLLDARFPVYASGRGGEYTYHGPGQRVAYVMMDLKRHFAPCPPDLRAYVRLLEQWIIETLNSFNVDGFTREGRVGVWVKDGASESKIAAIGVRVRHWVTFHGIALNVHPDLSHYNGIVPCGIREYGVTSLHALGVRVSMDEVDRVLHSQFKRIF